MMAQRLELVPLNQREAFAFIRQHHRHHGVPAGHLFAVGASQGGRVVAVAIVGRPVARLHQDGWTAEIIRLCSDGKSGKAAARRPKLYRLTPRPLVHPTLPS